MGAGMVSGLDEYFNAGIARADRECARFGHPHTGSDPGS
jgi:hypothetical protein